MDKKEVIIEILNNMSNCELLYIHREYLDKVNGFDDYIYSMDEFNEIMDGNDAEWIANRVYFGEYIPSAEYFKFDAYGNIQSIYSTQLLEYIDIDYIADYILDNDDALYNDDIKAILDEIDEVDEED